MNDTTDDEKLVDKRSTLIFAEPHPAAQSALAYVTGMPTGDYLNLLGVFASCAIEGNRLGEICVGTMNRLRKGEPVSDRYILGLAWAIQSMSGEGSEEDW